MRKVSCRNWRNWYFIMSKSCMSKISCDNIILWSIWLLSVLNTPRHCLIWLPAQVHWVLSLWVPLESVSPFTSNLWSHFEIHQCWVFICVILCFFSYLCTSLLLSSPVDHNLLKIIRKILEKDSKCVCEMHLLEKKLPFLLLRKSWAFLQCCIECHYTKNMSMCKILAFSIKEWVWYFGKYVFDVVVFDECLVRRLIPLSYLHTEYKATAKRWVA